MKDQLDQLMRSLNFDALWITGPANHNPSMRYFTGESHLTHAELFIRPDQEPLLFHSAMEREEAAGTGLSTKELGEYQLVTFIAECDGVVVLARAKMYQAVLEELGLASSRVALYGKTEVGSSWGVLSKLSKLLPALELVGEGRNSLLLNARATKDEEEIDRIRRMGKVTTDVVSRVARFLQSCSVGEDQVLLTPGGNS
jgi:Xaa-Pro aminopeptidase